MNQIAQIAAHPPREQLITSLSELAVALRDGISPLRPVLTAETVRVAFGQTSLPDSLCGLQAGNDWPVLEQVGRVAANLTVDCGMFFVWLH